MKEVKKLIERLTKKVGDDVLYFNNPEVFNFNGEQHTLYSAQKEIGNNLKVSFMVKGKKTMKIFSTSVEEQKHYPARNGGLEYYYEPMNTDVIDIFSNNF